MNHKIIEKIDTKLLIEEILLVEKNHKLFSRDKFDIFLVKSKLIPNILNEIGRLREITFRAAGEGTGRNIDIDKYDNYYHQLFIWDRINCKIVGGYRIGKGNEIFNKYGVSGFYINSLFNIQEALFSTLKKSLELGRSFIRIEYQKEVLPLFLLWKGILILVQKNSNYKYILGPLSISKHYSNISKTLIIQFVKLFLYDNKLSKYLEAKKPYLESEVSKDIIDFLSESNGKLNELDDFIQNLNPIKMRLPVLMKQYIKQNAKFIGFNLDPNFSDALDGFMILNLDSLPKETIKMLNYDKE